MRRSSGRDLGRGCRQRPHSSGRYRSQHQRERTPMSITTVKKAITTALRDRHVTQAEVGDILKAAKPSVSNVEAKALENLHRMVTTAPSAPPGAVICFPMTIERAALDDLNKFIGDKNLPIGSHESVMRDAINDFLSRARLGPPRTELPRSLSKLMELDLAV